MISLCAWHTPNGRKVSVMLEECALPWTLRKLDLGKAEQFADWFTAISPYSKIPAIEDDEGPGGRPIALFESGAILVYLAEKSGRLLPAEPRERYGVLQWLMFQIAGVGPMLGQAHHFRLLATERIPYAIERYEKEAGRLFAVLERRLAAQQYLAGEAFTIADVATYPWVMRHPNFGISLENYPAVRRWTDTISARPAVRRGMEILKPLT